MKTEKPSLKKCIKDLRKVLRLYIEIRSKNSNFNPENQNLLRKPDSISDKEILEHLVEHSCISQKKEREKEQLQGGKETPSTFFVDWKDYSLVAPVLSYGDLIQ